MEASRAVDMYAVRSSDYQKTENESLIIEEGNHSIVSLVLYCLMTCIST